MMAKMMAKMSTLSHHAASSRPFANGLAPSPPYSSSPGPSRKRQRDAWGGPRTVEAAKTPQELIEQVLESRLADLKRDMRREMKREMAQQLEGLKREMKRDMTRQLEKREHRVME